MNIYLFIFVIGYFLSILSIIKNTKEIMWIFFIVTAFLMFVLSGFRSMNIGYDNADHARFFYEIASGEIDVGKFKEPGYAFLSWLVSFSGDYHFFLIIYAIISIVILTFTIKYFSINPYVSLYMYYCFYFFGNNMAKIRQSMAMLILLLALKYLHKGERKAFIIIVFVAATFHASALIFLIILFLNKINLSKKRMYLFIFLAIIVGQSGFVEFIYYDLIAKSQLINSLSILDLSRLARYADSGYTVREGGGYLGFLYTFVNSILVVLFYENIKHIKDNKMLIIAKTYYWGSILFFTFFNLALINSRLTMAFLLTEIFLVPYLFKCIENKNVRFLFAVFYIFVVLLRGYMGFQDNYDNFVPYEFYWK